MIKATSAEAQLSAFSISDLNLSIAEGEIFCFTGRGGSGKSAIVSILSGKTALQSGFVTIDGVTAALLRRKKRLDLIADNSAISSISADHTVKDFLYLARRKIKPAFSFFSEHDKEIVNSLISHFALEPLQSSRVTHLSSSQRTAVFCAALLSLESKVTLFDNPSENADPFTAAQIRSAFRKITAKGTRTIVYATNDLNFATLCADTIAILDEGKIIIEGDSSVFSDAILSKYFLVEGAVSKNVVTGGSIIQYSE